MTESQLTQLFNLMQEQFALIRSGIEKLASQESLDRLTSAVDEYIKCSDDNKTK